MGFSAVSLCFTLLAVAATARAGPHARDQTPVALFSSADLDSSAGSWGSKAAVPAAAAAQHALKGAAKADVVVLMVQDHAAASLAADKDATVLQSMLKKDPKTAAVVPSVVPGAQAAPELLRQALALSGSARLWTSGHAADAVLARSAAPVDQKSYVLGQGAAAAVAGLASEQVVLKDGVQDVVLVAGATPADVEAARAALQKRGASFVVAFTGTGMEPSELDSATFNPVEVNRAHLQFRSDFGQIELSSSSGTYALFPGVIAQGLVLSLILLILLCIGSCCMFDLQSELQFGAEKAYKDKTL